MDAHDPSAAHRRHAAECHTAKTMRAAARDEATDLHADGPSRSGPTQRSAVAPETSPVCHIGPHHMRVTA